MKVLIYGLPGAGKTYIAERVQQYLQDQVVWFNADKVRHEANDWDFSDEGRLRQNTRMRMLCDEAVKDGAVAIADFVAPFENARIEFGADLEIFVDTIQESEYEDTNKVFQTTQFADYIVTEQRGDVDAINIAWMIANRFLWSNTKPTTQMLGRFQPWHDGHPSIVGKSNEQTWTSILDG